MNKTAFGIFLLALFCLGIWYYFSYEKDTTYTFQTSTAPGTVYKRILYWDYEVLEKKEDLSKTPFTGLIQELSYQDEEFLVTWNISALNDSITEVTAKIETPHKSGKNKFSFPGTSILQEEIKSEISLLTEAFKKDESFYNIKLKGPAISPGGVCACISLSSSIEEKASLMMANIQYLSDFVSENDLKMAGKPMIKVNKWNIEDDRIEYDFCFPLANFEGMDGKDKIFIREIKPEESLKATYNGNYMYSNLGWMALFNYADYNGISIQKMPLEVFHDNPEMGGDALNWKTEIFLPMEKK